jgi:hypothetical protein
MQDTLIPQPGGDAPPLTPVRPDLPSPFSGLTKPSTNQGTPSLYPPQDLSTSCSLCQTAILLPINSRRARLQVCTNHTQLVGWDRIFCPNWPWTMTSCLHRSSDYRHVSPCRAQKHVFRHWHKIFLRKPDKDNLKYAALSNITMSKFLKDIVANDLIRVKMLVSVGPNICPPYTPALSTRSLLPHRLLVNMVARVWVFNTKPFHFWDSSVQCLLNDPTPAWN